MDLVRNSKGGGVSSPSSVEYCGGVYNSSRVEQAVDAFMDRLGGRLGELEVELRYAWRAVDLLSQEYVKMWEKLERLEILLYEQQNVIAQLLQVIRNGGEDTDDLMASSVASDAERFLVKHRAAEGGAESSDGGEIFPSSAADLGGGGRYGSSETTSEWGSQGGSPGYFHPDLLQYPRREIFTASDYKRYRGGSPCISERDLEELDRLSANLQRAHSARDAVYRQLTSIRNSPLRTRSEVPDAGGGFDPESMVQFRMSNYEDFSNATAVDTGLTTALDPDVLRYTSDSGVTAKDVGYVGAGTSWSETSSPNRSLGLAYGSSGYASNVQIEPPAPPERGCGSSDYSTDPNFLGHTVEERQKGHALTPVTEISPEYTTSDTANNGERSPAHLKLDSVIDVTTSPMSPSNQPRTTTAEIHLSDKVRTSSKSPHHEVAKHKSKSSTDSTSKDKPRRVKELPKIPYQPCRLKKSELLSRTEPTYKKGSNNTFTPVKAQRQSKSSSPAPGRRKLPQPYIDKSGKITYDRSQGVKPATTVPYPHVLPQVPNVEDTLHTSKKKYDMEQEPTVQQQLDHTYGVDASAYDAVGYVSELSPEQNDSAKCSKESQQPSCGYEKVSNEPYYAEVSSDQTYQALPSESNEKTYTPTYYPQETDPSSYVAETYIEQKVDYQSSSKYVDQNSSIEAENYDWNQKTDQSWCETQQTSDQYAYNCEQANIPASDQQSYVEPPVNAYGDVTYDTSSVTYGDNQYNQSDQSYYGNEVTDTQYKDTQSYDQASYSYPSDVPYDNYAVSGQVDYAEYPENQKTQIEEQPATTYYEHSEQAYQEEYIPQPVDPQAIPPEKPLREHERAAKNERFTSSPQHKGYSPQKSKNSKHRRQRQYSDPVTSSCAILSQTPVTNSITQSTKQLSSSATSVAEDTSTTSGGIFSVLSNKVSKGYKMMSMPTLSKKETKPPPAASSNTAAASSKSGSMTSLFNMGMDSFKIGSKSKSRSNSVKSESELSVYEEPQAVVNVPESNIEPLQEPIPQQISTEEDHEVFEEPVCETNYPPNDYQDYQEPSIYPDQVEPEHPDPSQKAYPKQESTDDLTEDDYKAAIDYHGQRRRSFQEVKHPTIYQDEYQEDEFQDTSEYPDEYYATQEVEENEEYMQEEDELGGERTVTFAEESILEKHKRKKSIAAEEFASLFQTVSKTTTPTQKHAKGTAEDSTESGVLTESVSNESAFFSCVSDSRQGSIAGQSEYGSMDSVVHQHESTERRKASNGSATSEKMKTNGGPKQTQQLSDGGGESGSLESYGDRGRIGDGSEETEEMTEAVEVGSEEVAVRKGKKVQFESRSPSVGGETDQEDVGEGEAEVEEAKPDKSKKTIASTKSKWMKLAVRTNL